MVMFLSEQNWRFLNQSKEMLLKSPLYSFGTDDTLCHLVGHNQSEAVVRSWVHKKSVVLGIQDHRLPSIEQAKQYLLSKGYEPIVRNSGGLAVVLDEGILNISLVFKEQGKISIDQAFTIMVDFIKLLIPEAAHKIEVYEIVGSYCPGSFDLSIGGKKFAGISQRRMQNGIAVQIYLCVEGSGSERAAFIRDFYNIGIQGGEVKYSYPDVHPEVMASLQELLGNPLLTVEQLNNNIPKVLSQISTVKDFGVFQEEEQELFKYYLNRIFKRNESLLKNKDQITIQE